MLTLPGLLLVLAGFMQLRFSVEHRSGVSINADNNSWQCFCIWGLRNYNYEPRDVLYRL